MSRHHIHAIHDPDGWKLECRIHYTFHARYPGRYYVNPTPPEPASIEFVRAEIFVLGQWVEMPKLDEWAEAYLLGDGLPDAMENAAMDAIEAAESRAEARQSNEQAHNETPHPINAGSAANRSLPRHVCALSRERE